MRDLRSFVPFLADGGIAQDATLAMIGEGVDDEAVIPLNARKLQALGLGGGGGGQVIDSVVQPGAAV